MSRDCKSTCVANRLRTCPYAVRRWLAFGLLLLAPIRVLGQERVDNPPTTKSAAKSAEAAKPSLAQDFWDSAKDKIIIFLEDADKLGGRIPEQGRISIPLAKLDEYLKEKLAELQRPMWSITSLELTGIVQKDGVALDARIQIRVDHPNGASVNLALREAQCEHASDAAGRWPYLDRQQPDGPFRLIVDRPGTYQYRLQLWAPILRLPTERRLVLSLPAAAVKTVSLSSSVPLVSARHGTTNVDFELEDGRKVVRPRLRPAESLDIAFRTADDGAGGQAATSVRGLLNYHLEATTVRVEAELDIENVDVVREWSFRLPAKAQVTIARAQQERAPVKLRPPEVVQADGFTRVTIRSEDAISGSLRLRLEAGWDRIRQPESGTVEIGWLELENAEIQLGTIVVLSGSDCEIGLAAADHAERIPVGQLDDRMQESQPVAAFRYDRQPAKITVTVSRARPVMRGTASTRVHVSLSHATIESRMRYAIDRAATDVLRIRVPKSMSIDHVGPPDVVKLTGNVRTGGAVLPPKGSPSPKANNGSRESRLTDELIIPLQQPRRGEVEIVIRGSVPTVLNQRNQLALPHAAVRGERPGMVEVSADSNVKLTLEAGDLRNLAREPTPTDQQRASSPLSQPGQTSAAPAPVWFFRQGQGEPVLAFSPTRLYQRLSADLEAQLRRTAEGLAITSSLRFRAEHEPMDSVVLRIPDGLIGLTIEGDDRLAGELPGPGSITFPFPNPVFRAELRVSYRYPFAISTPAVHVPLVLPLLDQVEIRAFRAEIWTSPGERAEVEPPWRTALSDSSTSAGPTLVIGPQLADTDLAVRFEPAEVMARLVVPRAMVRECIFTGGRRQGLVRYYLAAHRTHTTELEAPSGTRFVQILVDGRVVTPVTYEDQLCRVALPADNRPCVVDVEYEVVESSSLGTWNRLILQPPRFTDAPVIGETRWELFTDSDWLVLNTGRDSDSQLRWRFVGFLQTPRAAGDANELDDWFRAGVLELMDRPMQNTSPGRPERRWLVRSWSHPVRLEVFCIREPFWTLVFSGACLVMGLAVAYASGESQLRTGLGLAVLAAALVATLPQSAAWIWLGAQWGAYAALLAIGWRIAAEQYRHRGLRIGRQPSSRARTPRTGALIDSAPSGLSPATPPSVGT